MKHTITFGLNLVAAAAFLHPASTSLADEADECSCGEPSFYKAIDLGPLVDPPNADNVGSFGINSLGQCVFYAEISGEVHGMLYLPEADYGLSAGLHDLDTLFTNVPGPHAAFDINDDGLIIGQADGVGAHSGEAILWDLNTLQFDLLGFLSGGEWSAGQAINNEDPPVIVGISDDTGACAECAVAGTFSGFKLEYDSTPVMVRLQAHLAGLDCDTASRAHDINTPSSGDARAAGQSTYGLICAKQINDLDPLSWESPAPDKMDEILEGGFETGSSARGIN